jgi:hypothetical protein
LQCIKFKVKDYEILEGCEKMKNSKEDKKITKIIKKLGKRTTIEAKINN